MNARCVAISAVAASQRREAAHGNRESGFEKKKKGRAQSVTKEGGIKEIEERGFIYWNRPPRQNEKYSQPETRNTGRRRA